jgi:hypothetical protein
VILVAGGIQLLRIAGEDSSEAEFSALGEAVQVGDLTVVVDSWAESGGVATVAVRLSGVDDDDGAAAFRLVVPGEPLEPRRGGAGSCGATTVAEQACTLEFPVAGAPGGSRILLYRRGDDAARWELNAG